MERSSRLTPRLPGRMLCSPDGERGNLSEQYYNTVNNCARAALLSFL
jgi:hypothetical protein